MFGAVIATERLLDRLDIGTTSRIAQARQHRGIAFAGEDRTDDPHPGRPGDVGDDVVNLQVHLRQSLLYVLDMGRRILEQTLALTDIRSQLGDPTLGPKAGAQQTIRMKPLQPLRITDVGLASRHVFGIARVDEENRKTPGVEKFEDWNPVHARGFHHDGLDTTFGKPIDQPM